MQIEILNIIKFLAYMLIIAIIYHQAKKHKALKVKTWKTYWVLMLIATLSTYTQFFTFTEKTDVLHTQNVMLNQSSHVSNGKSIAMYLHENKPEARFPSEVETADELVKQQLKSKTLAKEIDDKQGTKQ